MAPLFYSCSVPGSFMLMGEHAVLHGSRALVAAIDQRIDFTLKPRFDKRVCVRSSLGEFNHSIEDLNLETHPKFRFVLAAIISIKEALKTGFDLDIRSEISDTKGFGSSAAVTVGVLYVLAKWLLIPKLCEREQLALKAIRLIREIQGTGSGGDVLASVFGGVISYRLLQETALPHYERLRNIPPISCVYAGYKTPTPEAIAVVEGLRTRHPLIFETIDKTIHHGVMEAEKAIQAQHWEHLGQLCNMMHGQMLAMGVVTPDLCHLVNKISSCSGIFGAKMSGAGLGDCAIGIGKLPADFDINQIDVEIAKEGVLVY